MVEDSTALDFLEGQQALSEISALQDEIKLASALSSIENAFPVLWEAIKAEDPNLTIREICVLLIQIMFESLDNIRLQGELFGISLYLYNEKLEDKKLLDFYSYKNPMMGKEPGCGRAWELTNRDHSLSHIVQTFNDPEKDYYILEDIRQNPTDSSKELLENDYKFYVSAVEIPIFYSNGTPRGIFCVTSSYEGRFGKKIDSDFDCVSKINQLKKYNFIKIASFFEMMLQNHNNIELLNLISKSLQKPN